MKAHGLAIDRAVHLHRHGDQAETDRTGPDRSGHASNYYHVAAGGLQDLARRARGVGRSGASICTPRRIELVAVEALLSASAPADEGATSRVRSRASVLYCRLLTLAIGLCAALPVVTAAVRALHEGWQPVADRGIIATRAFDVFSSHTPLVGQYSFTSTVVGKLTYSLGPMLYWLLAPAAHIGAPQSFVWTIAAVNVGSILRAVALAPTRGGTPPMLPPAVR